MHSYFLSLAQCNFSTNKTDPDTYTIYRNVFLSTSTLKFVTPFQVVNVAPDSQCICNLVALLFSQFPHTCCSTATASSLKSVYPNISLSSYMEQSFEKLIVTQLVKKFPHFKQPECSLSSSLEPATESYHESLAFGPLRHILLFRPIIMFQLC